MKATICTSKPTDGAIAFTDFQVGEFLVSKSGNVGVKTLDGGILWIVGPTTNVGTVTYAHNISRNQRYNHPVSVMVTV